MNFHPDIVSFSMKTFVQTHFLAYTVYRQARVMISSMSNPLNIPFSLKISQNTALTNLNEHGKCQLLLIFLGRS